MSADLFARLLLDNSKFESSIRQSKRSTNNMKSEFGDLSKVMGNVTKTLGSLAGAVGIATTGYEAFNKAIRSNQTISDAYDRQMAAVKTTVNEFFHTLTTGDFSIFNTGLDNLITRAREAYNAIDQLGNTLMSYAIIDSEMQQKIAEAQDIVNDPNSSKEAKEKALSNLKSYYSELSDAAKVAIDDYVNAIQTEVSKKSNVNADLDTIVKMAKLDATKGRDEAKAYYTAKYKEYKKLAEAKQKELDKEYFTTEVLSASEEKYQQYMKEKKQKMQEFNDQYKEAIIYHTLIEKDMDGELKNIGQQVISMNQLNGQVHKYSRQINKLDSKVDKNDDSTPKKEKEKLPKIDLSEVDPFPSLDEWINNFSDRTLKALLTALPNSIDEIESMLKQWEDLFNKAGNDAGREYANSVIKALKTKKNEMENGATEGVSAINKQLSNEAKGLKVNTEYLEEMQDAEEKKNRENLNAYYSTASAVGDLGSAFSNLGNSFESPALNVAGIIAQAIANVMFSYGQILSNTASHGNWYEWVAVAAAGLAEVTSVVSQIRSLSSYATGGIIDGTRQHGDNNLIRVNSGEMVLNKNQQVSLWHLLDDGVMKGESSGNVHFRIQGTDLVGVLNNYNKKNNRIR